MTDVFDLAIIGGGINGCGIARDAAGRGLKVFLCERNDLGAATSSASTKLLHGGLRYLEHCEFRLVREALEEREILWGIAPHIVRPLRFVLPHVAGMRPQWLLRTGLFLYDHLGGRRALPGTVTVDLGRGPLAQSLRPITEVGFEYSDCWVEDARLVVLNAQSARDAGAQICTRSPCTHARIEDGQWLLTVVDADTGDSRLVKARMLVNAAGPWANTVAAQIAQRPPQGKVRLVQGSHLVVPRLYDHDRCFIFQNHDGRIVFTIPYEDRFTLIGTTDHDFAGQLDAVQATAGEIDYLCAAASGYFQKTLTPADVVWSYSGVRPLYDDGSDAAQAATRDYTLELDTAGGAPLLSIFGGKITTYRRLSEAAIARLEPHFTAKQREISHKRSGWTGRSALPGGEFLPEQFDDKVRELSAAYPFLSAQQAVRLTRYYGTRARQILGSAREAAALGEDFGAGLTEAELDHMVTHEWAQTADDVLWRRSKLGLHMDAAQRQKVADHLASLKRTAARPPGVNEAGDQHVHGHRPGNIRRQDTVDQ